VMLPVLLPALRWENAGDTERGGGLGLLLL
jgi:hypothetical protein